VSALAEYRQPQPGDHPDHLVRETPRREAMGVAFVEAVIGPPPTLLGRLRCRRSGGHWWHPAGLRRDVCCQCYARRRARE
jgi:hypothetical protein